MAHETNYKKCSNCGGVTITTIASGKKIKSTNCNCMDKSKKITLKNNEIRVGNFLSGFSSNIFWTVEGIDKEFIYSSNAWRLLNCFEPIEITEQWLIDFGFKLNRESSVVKEWVIGFNEITHDVLFYLNWLKHIPVNKKEYKEYPFYRNGRHRIKYVHELQNLYFALTNEELILNK